MCSPLKNSSHKTSSWKKFPIPKELLKALKENGLNSPLPIQVKSMKATLLNNLNVLGAAQTGSGKTLAYAIPMLTHILNHSEENHCSKLKTKICKLHKKEEDFELIDGQMMQVEDMIVDNMSDLNESEEDSDDQYESANEFVASDDNQDSSSQDFSCPEAIILVPTRELANQVKEQVDLICKYTQIRSCCLIGGLSQDKQLRILDKRKPQVIIATPGRLYEIVQSDSVKHLNVQSIASIRTLIIDEADRMIQKGHFEEMIKIIDFIKEHKKFRGEDYPFRVYLFSATLTFLHELPERFKMKPIYKKEPMKNGIKKDKDNKVVNPKEHTKRNKIKQILNILGIEKSETRLIDLNDENSFGRPNSDQLQEFKVNCLSHEKDLYLYYFLRENKNGRALVFCNSKDCLRRLTNVLKFLGIKALNLHADMDQKKRLSSLEKFRRNSPSVLIATDVAARGLDIKELDCVIHYQVPKTCESYIHRSGRTARLNNKGTSLTLIEPKETPFYRRLCNNINSGKDFEDYDFKLKLRAILKDVVSVAQQCDKLEYHLRETKTDRSWFTKAAKECDIELDEDELRHLTGRGRSKEQCVEEDAKKRRQLSALQKQLTRLLNRVS